MAVEKYKLNLAIQGINLPFLSTNLTETGI